jgi:hypothetical protein
MGKIHIYGRNGNVCIDGVSTRYMDCDESFEDDGDISDSSPFLHGYPAGRNVDETYRYARKRLVQRDFSRIIRKMEEAKENHSVIPDINDIDIKSSSAYVIPDKTNDILDTMCHAYCQIIMGEFEGKIVYRCHGKLRKTVKIILHKYGLELKWNKIVRIKERRNKECAR